MKQRWPRVLHNNRALNDAPANLKMLKDRSLEIDWFQGWLVPWQLCQLKFCSGKVDVDPTISMCYTPQTWWWQLKYFWIFTPKIGEDEPILTHIFQLGWNHQLVMLHTFDVFFCSLFSWSLVFFPKMTDWHPHLLVNWPANIETIQIGAFEDMIRTKSLLSQHGSGQFITTNPPRSPQMVVKSKGIAPKMAETIRLRI